MIGGITFEQRFLVGRFSLYKVCLVKCWRRHFACARRLFVGILRMLVNVFFCVGGVGGSVLQPGVAIPRSTKNTTSTDNTGAHRVGKM